MSEPARWTAVFRAVKAVPSGRVHLVATIDVGRCWTICGRLLHAGNSRLAGQVSLDEVGCATCRDANLEERRRLRPGWWGRR